MSATEIIQIITALTTLITAIGGVVIAVRTTTVKRTVDETQTMLSEQQEKLTTSLQNVCVKDYKDGLRLKR
jgi:flagellar motor component MotA